MLKGFALFFLLEPDVVLFVFWSVDDVTLDLVEEFFACDIAVGVMVGREVCGLVVVAVPVRFFTDTRIPVILNGTSLWILGVDVQRDTEAECWSVLLFGFVEEIAFFAEENAGTPSFRAKSAQLLVAVFDVDAGATMLLIMQRSIDSQKMIENSPPKGLLSFFPVVATYGPVELVKICLIGRGGSIGNGDKIPG